MYGLKRRVSFWVIFLCAALLSSCASTSVYRMVRDETPLYAPLYVPAMALDIATFPVQYLTGGYFLAACFSDRADDTPFCIIPP
jgi:hypothetical protein